MLNIKKLSFFSIFFGNLLILGLLGFITSIDITNYSFDKTIASSLSIKNYIVFLIVLGQILLIIKLTKLKFVRNIASYKVSKGYFAIGPFLMHFQHHPACSCYKSHELTLRNQQICSGCYGSSLGIIFGVLILLSSSFLSLPFDVYFYIAVIFIQSALLKTWFNQYPRFILNGFFPLGINLLLAGSFSVQYGLIISLLFVPFLLLEFVLRLFIPSLDQIPQACPEGLVH